MAEKKKILYIVEAMGGGVFTYIVDLANELVNKYDMYIAYAVRKQTPKNYKDYFDKRIHLMHNEREEVWTVVSGKGKAIVDGMEQVLRTGDVITIAAGCKHTVKAITPLDMIEVQLGDEISVSDKIKFELD